MARIRSIKPEFWSDYRLATELTRDQRLFYVALWNEADDEGRFSAHPRRLLGACFPYDEDIAAADIRSWLQRLAETGRVRLYEVDGEPYGELTKFRGHQQINRPSKSRIPAPVSEGSVSIYEPIAEASLNTHGGLSEASSPHARAPELEQGAGSRDQEQGSGAGIAQSAGDADAPSPAPAVVDLAAHRARRDTAPPAAQPPARKTRSSRGKPPPKVARPTGWAPSAEHRSQARRLDLDVDECAARFCRWADANGVWFADWDGRFSLWLDDDAKRALHLRKAAGAEDAFDVTKEVFE
jgi:hypothetical protein